MTDSCKTCKYFDSKDGESKNWCRYNDMSAINEGLCGHYEPMIMPCPFCGADSINLTLEEEDGNPFIYCAVCDMVVEHAYPGISKEKLIEHWNRRMSE